MDVSFDAEMKKVYLTDVVIEMHKYNVKVSLFIDPDPKQIEASAKTGADFIEIHTGEYANARNEKEQFEELKKIKEAAKTCKKPWAWRKCWAWVKLFKCHSYNKGRRD